MVCHVTGRVDVGGAGPAQLVGQDPVLLRDRDVRDVRFYPDARHGEIARDTLSGRGHDRLQAFGPFEAGDLVSGQQLDAVRAVDGANQGADLAAQDRLQRGPAREDRGHPDAQLGQRGRHLAADEPHANDDRAPARRRLSLDRIALGHRAQVVDPGQPGPGNAEPPVPSARGDQDLLVSEFFARAQDDRVRGGIDGRHARSAAQVNVVSGIPAGLDVPAVEILLRPQVGLGQRRPAEGNARLRADEHDRSPETLLPEGGGGVSPCETTADDYDRARAGSFRHEVHSAIAISARDSAPVSNLQARGHRLSTLDRCHGCL